MRTPFQITSFLFLLFAIVLQGACGYPVEHSLQDVDKQGPSQPRSITFPLLGEPLSARAFDVTPGELVDLVHSPSASVEEPSDAIFEGAGYRWGDYSFR